MALVRMSMPKKAAVSRQMGLLVWKDGVLKKGRRELRQVPAKHVWSSALWCSKNGYLIRRFWNPADRRGFVSVEHIIALTWRMRAPDDTSQVSRVGRRRYRTAKNLQWTSEEADREDQAPLPGETWSPLKYKCGIVSCDRSYEISSMGRLRSPHTGIVTSGFYFAKSRWAGVKDCGLVDLLVASGIHQPAEPHPPCIKDALTCMMSGDHPEDMLHVTNATEKSLWSYFARAIEFAEPSELKMVWPLLVPDSL